VGDVWLHPVERTDDRTDRHGKANIRFFFLISRTPLNMRTIATVILTTALDGLNWTASNSGRFTPAVMNNLPDGPQRQRQGKDKNLLFVLKLQPVCSIRDLTTVI